MKEITIDTTRCPGLEVCGDKTCLSTFGESFYRRIVKSGFRGLISESKYKEEEDNIEQVIIRCPAQAIGIKEYQG